MCSAVSAVGNANSRLRNGEYLMDGSLMMRGFIALVTYQRQSQNVVGAINKQRRNTFFVIGVGRML